MTLAGIQFKTASYSQESYIMVVFTIDCDYEELVQAIDLDYVRRKSDLKVSCYTNSTQELESWLDPDFTTFCENVLNPDLAESCSYVMVYRKPRRGSNRYKGGN